MEILTEKEIAKLLASKREREERLGQLARCKTGHDTRHYHGWLYEIDALCATVKHLRKENDEYERRWRNQTQRNHTLSQTNRDLQSQLEQLRAENQRLKNPRLLLASDLQSKLAQLEQERDRILQLYNSAWLWVQQRVKHPNSGVPPAAMTLIEMLPLLNQRAIQLCKDKAADLNREVNKVDPDDDPTYFQILAARIATSNELAEALEKL